MDLEIGPAEEPIPNGNVSSSHSGREASGSELSSTANAVIISVDVSTFSHTLDDGVPEDIIPNDAGPIEENSNGLSSGIHDPPKQASASFPQLLSKPNPPA